MATLPPRSASATKRTPQRQTTDKPSPETLTPLDYMLRVIRDETADADRRDEMAKLAAPYMHPKLANAEPQGPAVTLDLTNISDEQLAALEILFGPLAGSGGDDGRDPGGEEPAAD